MKVLVVQWLSSKEIDTANLVRTLDKVIYVSNRSNTFEKDMNPTIIRPSMSKSLGRPGSLTWIQQPV